MGIWGETFSKLFRAAYALGGLGSGFAENEKELRELTKQAFAHSNQVSKLSNSPKQLI